MRIENGVKSLEIVSLSKEPIFSGIGKPGSRVIVRLFDQFGQIIGHAQSIADPGGNWMMQVHEVEEGVHYRVEFQQTTSFNFLDFFGIDPANNTYQELNVTTKTDRVVDPSFQQTIDDSSSQSLKRQHQWNQHPISPVRRAA